VAAAAAAHCVALQHGDATAEAAAAAQCASGLDVGPLGPLPADHTLPDDLRGLGPSPRNTPLAATAWWQLRCFLRRHEHARLYVAAAETAVRTSAMQLPLWLVAAFQGAHNDSAALLRVYLTHGRLQEAAAFAVDLLQTSGLVTTTPSSSPVAGSQLTRKQQQQQQRQRHAGVWLPHTLLATLQAQLSERVATPSAAVREPHLRPLAARLRTLLAAHTAAADQATRVLLA
jgi:hypothetical protein